MYFQLEVKYKNVQLIVSTKNNLKIAIDCTGHCARNHNLLLVTLLLGLQSTLLLGLVVA